MSFCLEMLHSNKLVSNDSLPSFCSILLTLLKINNLDTKITALKIYAELSDTSYEQILSLLTACDAVEQILKLGK